MNKPDHFPLGEAGGPDDPNLRDSWGPTSGQAEQAPNQIPTIGSNRNNRDDASENEFDSDEERRVDAMLRRAANETRTVVDRQPVPAFRAGTNRGRQVLGVAAALFLVVGAVGVMLAQRSAEEPTGVATTDDVSEATDSADPNDDNNGDPIADPGSLAERHPGLPEPQPGNQIDNLNNTKAPATETALAEPDLYSTYVDPAFGAKVVRVTDANDNEYITPQIPQAFNADESLVLLYRTSDDDGNGHWLFDGETFKLLRSLDVSASDIEHLYWSGVDPDLLYLIEGQSLIELNVDTDTRTALATFEDCDTLSSGVIPVPPSTDGNTFGLFCEAAEGNMAIAVKRDGDNITTSIEPTTAEEAPMPSPSGRFFVEIDGSGATNVLDRNLAPTGVTFDSELSTFAYIVDADGRELAVTTQFNSDANGTAILLDLETGTSTTAIGVETDYPYPPDSHRLRSATGTPYVAVGIGGDPDVFDDGVLDGEVVLIDLVNADNPEALRLAHHRSSLSSGPWSKPFVSVSPSGTKVLFSSDWGTGHTNTYLVAIDR